MVPRVKPTPEVPIIICPVTNHDCDRPDVCSVANEFCARQAQTEEPSLVELERGLRIDRHNLDEALEHQPDLFYRVSKQLTLELSRRDAAKQALAETEAHADAEVRSDASIAGEKITEKEVESQKFLRRDVAAARVTLSDCNFRVGQLSALKEAFQQRSYVLKELTALYSANYYGDLTQSGSEQSLRDRSATIARRAMDRARHGQG